MHVASKDKIELFELFFDGFVRDVDRGVNEHNLGLFLWKLSRKLGRFIEFFEQDIYVFAARMENAALLFGDVIEVVIDWRKSKTEDIEFIIFVAGVVEIVNIVDFADGFDEAIVAFGDIATVFAEARFETFFLSIEIMISEAEADGRNFGDARYPSFEAGDFVGLVDRLKGID